MSVSGVTTWNPTKSQLIHRALRIVGAVGTGQTASGSVYSDASDALNGLVKSLQAEGASLFHVSDYESAAQTASVVIGTDTLNYTCKRSHTASTANKPITGAKWSLYWIQSGTGGAAWVDTTAYTSDADLSLPASTIGVEYALLNDGQNDYELQVIPYQEYLKITQKDSTGRPDQIAIDWQLTPVVYIYPRPDQTDYVYRFRVLREVYDFNANGDTMDFTKLWNEALVFGLAERLSHEYGMDLNERQLLLSRYDKAKGRAMGKDVSNQMTDFIVPAFSYGV